MAKTTIQAQQERFRKLSELFSHKNVTDVEALKQLGLYEQAEAFVKRVMGEGYSLNDQKLNMDDFVEHDPIPERKVSMGQKVAAGTLAAGAALALGAGDIFGNPAPDVPAPLS
ncbi:hypothetical protein GF367_01960, partial [Candidatus Woesearchaeota archaeon]|nr:hypothetical protein [Candidatus Woesearchaeota archaeon]